jgi:proteasome assembly chaperone (PAC2) family protein
MAPGSIPEKETWLVAAWPGMGSVALAGAGYLVAKLGGRPVETIVKREYFDVNAVPIENGLVRRGPKTTLYALERGGRNGPDLLVLIGEAQPSHRSYEFCNEIIDLALARGVRRVVTFAAMATPVHPTAPARVFGVATEEQLLPLLARHDVSLVGEGQISGLNGLLLGAAADRGVEGFCLLGELPQFAAHIPIPNAKASLVVLEAFAKIAGIEIDLGELRAQAKLVERGLSELLDRLAQAQQQASEGAAAEPTEATEKEPPAETIPAEPAVPTEPAIPPATLQRIEELFRSARADKSQAMKLKSLLDELGLFRRYEDRFLDLFRKEEHG